MKVKLTSTWLLLCASIHFSACKSPDQDVIPVDKKETSAHVLIEEARIWYQSQSSIKTAASRSGSSDRYLGNPYWILAKGVTDGEQILKVPMTGYLLKNIGYRKYYFKKDANGTMRGVILEVLFKPSYWRKKVKEVQEKNGVVSSTRLDFTGVILQYDLEGNFVKGKSYKNGEIASSIIPKSSFKTWQQSNRSAAEDSEDPDEDSDIDLGETQDDGSGSGWVIDLPGVDITPDPTDPLPGWTLSDPPSENPYPPGEPTDYFPGTSPETDQGNGITSSSITASSTFDDEVEPAGVPAPIDCGATEMKQDGLIISVSGYWAQPRMPIVEYISGSRTVTRRTQIMDLWGTAAPLPGAVVTVRWNYIINYTYNYIPYSLPVTRQRPSFTVKVVYAN